MTSVQVFVLRVLVNPAEPQALRGSVQALSESETRPFADEQALIALLHKMVSRMGEAGLAEPSQITRPGRPFGLT